jgi:hypothetical protein
MTGSRTRQIKYYNQAKRRTLTVQMLKKRVRRCAVLTRSPRAQQQSLTTAHTVAIPMIADVSKLCWPHLPHVLGRCGATVANHHQQPPSAVYVLSDSAPVTPASTRSDAQHQQNSAAHQ